MKSIGITLGILLGSTYLMRLQLSALTLSANTIQENSSPETLVGHILGKSSAGVLSLIDSAGGRFNLVGDSLVAGLVSTDFESAQNHSITIRESISGFTRDTTLIINVINVAERPALAELTLSQTLILSGQPTTVIIVGATAGSTLSGVMPAGLTLNSAERTITGSLTSTVTFSLTETLEDSPNSPRTTTSLTITVYSPSSLFSMGEIGYWLDPSDFSTMWQDHQGVSPVTAIGQTCGLILDKSIGTRTEVFDDANVTFSGTGAGRISPGVYEYARDSANNGSVSFGGLVSGRTYLIRLQIDQYRGSIPDIVNVSADFRSALNAALRPAASAGTHTAFYIADGSFVRIGSSSVPAGGTISNVSILEIPGNHFRQPAAASRPRIQADGVHNFLAFDGTDDWLQSAATINPGSVDKAQVFAGVRKLSDAGGGTLLESSASSASNNGSFNLQAPVGPSASYSYTSRGTLETSATIVNAAYAAPVTNVLAGFGDISGDSALLRINGTQVASSAADQGTGNYLAYSHFIGRRGGTELPFNGRVYQLIVRYGPNLSISQVTQTEAFVNSKTGAY